jgi:hypothetical protein
VILNTATPALRFAGISVQDSGSNVGVTGSIFWDGLCNRWIYSNPSDIGYSGGMLLSGPRSSTLGSESPLTCNYVAKSGGGDHLYDSCIIDDGTTTCIKNNLISTGTINGTTIYGSTVVCSAVGLFSGCVGIGTATPTYDLTLSKSVAAGNVVLNIENTSTTGAARLWFGNNAASTGARIQYFGATHAARPNLFSIGTDAANDMMFETAGTERMRITSTGIACFSNTICACGLDLSNTGRTTLRIFSGPTDNEPGIELWSSYPSAAERNWRIGTSDSSLGDFVIKSSITCGGSPDSGCIRLQINNAGAACFACELTAKTIGTNDLRLSNINYECANYVDGTRGSWLIQEGESDLFIINQISCKKYKFNLIEIK